MKSKTLQWLAIILLLQSGVLHWADAQAQYQKIPYLGYLAMSYVVGASISIILIYFRKWIGWLVGLLVTAVSITVYVLMRVIALPGLAVEPWLYPYGVIGTVVEALFILLFFVERPWKKFLPVVDAKPASRRLSFLFSLFGVVFISGITYGADRWDSFAYQLGYHQHVGSYSAVCNTLPLSMEELEREYGVKVSMAGISALGSVVDVRIMVTDPKKAETFLQNQGAILVDQEVLILAPHVHTHLWRLKKNKVFVAFFSTQNGRVHSGSEISLVYGTVRVEPIIVQ